MDTPDRLNVREEMNKERDELLDVLADRLLDQMKALTATAKEMNVNSLPTLLKAWSVASQYGMQKQLADQVESLTGLMLQLQVAGARRVMTPITIIQMDRYLETGDEALLDAQITDMCETMRRSARIRRAMHLAQQTPPANGSDDTSAPDGKVD